MKFNSLQTRICFTAGLCLLISCASLVSYGLYSSTANQAYVGTEVSALIESGTIREVQNLAESRANAIKAKLQNALDSARTLADALDGQDQAFRNNEGGNNPLTGRFTPYWTRSSDGHVAVQPLVEYDSDARHPNG